MPASPALAELARQLLGSLPVGVLSTHSLHAPGYPFGSMTPFAADEKQRPLFLFSGLAEHTHNVLADPRAGLCLMESTSGEQQAAARVTYLGDVTPVPPEEAATAQAAYVARHPQAKMWSSFGDFRMFRMEVQRIYVVAGFGRMGWIRPEQAQP